MTKSEIAQAYIAHLSKGDLQQLLVLFAENARVISPVYGEKNYKDFYIQLFADTQTSELSIQGIFEDAETGKLALHFDYGWTLRNGSKVNFEVVDILEFDENNKIAVLTIIYDTVHSREGLKKLGDS